MAALSFISAAPLAGNAVAGTLSMFKCAKAAKIVSTTTRVINNATTFTMASVGMVESSKVLYHNIKNGEIFTWENAFAVGSAIISGYTAVHTGKSLFSMGKSFASNVAKKWSGVKESVSTYKLNNKGFVDPDAKVQIKSGSIKQVEYGSTDLSQEAIRYRQKNNITGARNIAVYEYESNGQLSIKVGASQRNQGHAERLIAKELGSMGIQSTQVRRIYSELEPCSIPGGYCKRFLKTEFPQADVTYSFEYGLTQESRSAGVKALKEAVKKNI